MNSNPNSDLDSQRVSSAKLDSARIKELKLLAVGVREWVIKSTHAAACGHPGGCLSAADYLTYLYHQEIRVNPENPGDPDRDRFVLSKGHSAPALYAVLAQRGFFPEEELMTLRKLGSRLQGHPDMLLTPGIDMTTGSLGQGISASCGMAKGAKYLKKDIRVYVLLGDGEVEEGEVWEAAMFASHYRLDNLCIAVDVNRLQIDGATEDVMNSAPLDKKFEAFGCAVISIDGQDFKDIERGFDFFHDNLNNGCGKPTVLLMNTLKGKGVSFMEDAVDWHGKATNDAETEQALKEISEERRRIMDET